VPTPALLFFCVFFAFFPDLDLAVYLPLRKKYDWNSHWELWLHWPIYALPFASFVATLVVVSIRFCFKHVSQIFFLEHVFVLFITTSLVWLVILAFLQTFCHFIHDAWQKQGLPLFRPISNVRITFYGGWPKAADPEDVRLWQEKHRSRSLDHQAEITTRVEDTEKWQFIVGGVEMLCLIYAILL
jgi:hypothetical protein